MRYLPHYPGPRATDIPGEFGWSPNYWCEDCHGLEREPRSVCVSRRTFDEPAEYAYVCPLCGGTDVDETNSHAPIKAIRRRRIHSNHSMRIAA